MSAIRWLFGRRYAQGGEVGPPAEHTPMWYVGPAAQIWDEGFDAGIRYMSSMELGAVEDSDSDNPYKETE